MNESQNFNLSAFEEGMIARNHDEETSSLTENPYPYDSVGFWAWYKGYNLTPEQLSK